MSEKNSDNGSAREFDGFQVKSAIFNATCELTDSGLELTVEDAKRLGKACEAITGQRWYGFITGLLNGSINTETWERKSYGHRLGKGIAGMYRRMLKKAAAA